MKARFTLLVAIVFIALQASANNIIDKMDFQKMEVPEMKAELVELGTIPEEVANMNSADINAVASSDSWKPDFSFFKSRTNPGTKPYKFLDDMTFVGIPLFAAGLAVKGDKAMFRVNTKDGKKNTQLLTDFKTGIDDYTQFFGPAMVVGLKLAGVEGRSDWPRLLASAGMSYGLMALLVNGIKYTAKEMRPDGSTANSWPSGHTATAFVGATLLHKEYGLTRSPWYSVAGYGVATATGVMRVLNNRHWISDVMSGAGLGILSGELGYAICNTLFKGKGLLRNDLEMDFENPSFFSISMGVGLGGKDIEFTNEDLVGKEFISSKLLEDYPTDEQIQFRAATVVDAEGAYFFNKYVGVGGRFRIRAMSAKSFGLYSYEIYRRGQLAWDCISELSFKYNNNPNYNTLTKYKEYYFNKIGLYAESDEEYMANSPVTDIYGVVKSDHMTEFTGSVGLYFNIPLSERFALGTKALIGRSITQELDVDGHIEGNVKDIDYTIVYHNGEFNSGGNVNIPTNTGEKYSYDWDYITLGGDNSTSFGTGISLTYQYKSNFSWRIFFDYDYTEKNYTFKYNPYEFLRGGLTENAYALANLSPALSIYTIPVEFKKKKKMHFFTAGLSFMVNL